MPVIAHGEHDSNQHGNGQAWVAAYQTFCRFPALDGRLMTHEHLIEFVLPLRVDLRQTRLSLLHSFLQESIALREPQRNRTLTVQTRTGRVLDVVI